LAIFRQLFFHVQLHTPTPAALPEAIWEAHTLSNIHELKVQSTLIRNRMQRHKRLSPASIIKAIVQFKERAEVMMLSTELMCNWITNHESKENYGYRSRGP
jgi:hypothetical protein